MVDVLIKNVDKNAYKVAKIWAVEEEKTVGQIISEAIAERAKAKAAEKRKKFNHLPLMDLGPKNKNLSREIDDILYGPRA